MPFLLSTYQLAYCEAHTSVKQDICPRKTYLSIYISDGKFLSCGEPKTVGSRWDFNDGLVRVKTNKRALTGAELLWGVSDSRSGHITDVLQS